MTQSWIFCHVRPGFEDDLNQELAAHLKGLGSVEQEFVLVPDSGYLAVSTSSETFASVRQKLLWRELVFARQLMWSTGPVTLPESGDRVKPLIDSIPVLLEMGGYNAFSGFIFETPDADEIKELSGFCKSLARPTENALNKLKVLPKGKGAAHLPKLVLVMVDSTTVWPCIADIENSSPWSMGIPRLKFPTGAPSRSTLKLEEAFYVFLGPEGIGSALKPGMTGVDLGACPGGWTFQLVQKGLKVAAVDNGRMDQSLMDSGFVTHHREDAFHFEPRAPVDWLVCDVVEQPSLITDLMAQWFTRAWCQQAVFNLKLPMKFRYAEVQNCLEKFKVKCSAQGLKVQVHCKQLFHDRKEVTVYVKRS